MQTQLKIQTDKVEHFLKIVDMSNNSGKQTGLIEVASTSVENDITLVNLEFGEPGDLFELGMLFIQIKPDVKLDNQTTMIPAETRGKPSFKIEFK